METCRIAERKDYRTINMRCHLLHDFFRESLGLCRCADQNVWVDLFDDGEEIVMVFALPIVVFAGIRNLGMSEGVTMGFEEETGLVDAPARRC